MRLWLDDQIDDPETPARWPPEGWTGVKSALAACRWLATGTVTHVSLDHDLGPGFGDGYLVARFIEKRAFLGRLHRLEWTVHSANPVGRARMTEALQRADAFWSS